jgi:hypothetical protein
MMMKKWMKTAAAALLFAALAIPAGNTFADAETALPFADDEYLVLTTGENNYSWLGGDQVVILDNQGNIVQNLSGYGIVGNGPSMSDGLLLSKDTPLMLFTGEKPDVPSDSVSYQSGLFSLETMDWIVEPQQLTMELFGNSVYLLCGSPDAAAGTLCLTDGTVLEEDASDVYQYGDYIIDSKAVYDAEGNMLMTFGDGTHFRSLIGDDIVQIVYLEDGSHKTILTDSSGNLIWEENTGLVWQSAAGEFTSWTDADGAGVICANWHGTVQPIIEESMFMTLNPEAVGTGMQVAAIYTDTETGLPRNIIRMDEDGFTSHYYLCDENYEILKEYPVNQVYQETVTNGEEPDLWYWNIGGDYIAYVENLATGSTFSWTQKDLGPDSIPGMYQTVSVMQEGPITGVQYGVAGSVLPSYVCGTERQNEVFSDDSNITGRIAVLDDGTIEVYTTAGQGDNRQMLYYSGDGTLLTDDRDGQVLFCNQSLICSYADDAVTITDTAGTVLETLSLQ